MHQHFYDMVEANPVIAAVKNEKGLKTCCLLQEIKVVFILFGDVCSIGGIVRQIKAAGKLAMVHLDLINGLAPKEVSVDFIHRNTQADGIISTKPFLIQRAREQGMYTVLRFFLLDSMAFQNIGKQAAVVQPDLIEVLPGLMPKVIRRVTQSVSIPVIAGGLISEKEDVIVALDAGALAVSTTDPSVWRM